MVSVGVRCNTQHLLLFNINFTDFISKNLFFPVWMCVFSVFCLFHLSVVMSSEQSGYRVQCQTEDHIWLYLLLIV